MLALLAAAWVILFVGGGSAFVAEPPLGTEEAKGGALAEARAGSAEPLTFLVTSDAHYDAFENEERNARNRETIEEMNRIAEESWPEALGGGPIGKPRGVLALGDLIDDGDRMLEGKHQTPVQWERYVADFGLDGTDGLLRYPVYEGCGNHDGPPAGKERFGFSFQAKIAARNAIRKEKGLVDHLAPGGLHYSWDWGPVHIVQLNLYPGSRPHPKTRYSPAYHDPQGSLDFLVEDLAEHVGESGRPVVLAHHYDLQGTDWWHEEERRAYYDAIAGYNVIAVFHGHTGTGVYRWKPAAREASEAPKGDEGAEGTGSSGSPQTSEASGRPRPAEGTQSEGAQNAEDSQGPNVAQRAERPLDVVNTGQTERGFFVVEISPRRFRTAYRVKRDGGPEGNPEGKVTWSWAHLLERRIEPRAP